MPFSKTKIHVPLIKNSGPLARKIYTLLGLISTAIFLTAAVIFVTNVEKFSQDLLIPCQKGEKASFDCPQIADITSKPLRYLGNGDEAIAFVSADDQYVMKLFLKYHIFKNKTPTWRKCIQRLSGFRFTRRSPVQILKRYSQGFSALADITGVLAVHRYRSPEQLPNCTLIDKRGIKHTLDLNDFAFVIQKKGHLVSQKEWESDRKNLDAKFKDLFTTIANKGFVSLSATFNRDNFAILDDKAIMIDLGKLEYLPKRAYATEEKRFQERYITVVGPAPQ
jgi:hypothetical protein